MSKYNSVLIQGSSRGIGLEYVKQFLYKHNIPNVIACCRDPSNAMELNTLQSQLNSNQKLHIISLDLNDDNTIINASKEVESILNGNSLNCLINCSGILHDKSKEYWPERSINMIEREWLNISMMTHCIGPAMVIKHFYPLMIPKIKNEYSVIINMSARIGSISDNNLGGWYSYRSTKAALNQMTKTMSIELIKKNIITYCLHPGTVDTNLSKPFNVRKDKLFDVDNAVNMLIDIINSTNINDNGKFYDYKRELIGW